MRIRDRKSEAGWSGIILNYGIQNYIYFNNNNNMCNTRKISNNTNLTIIHKFFGVFIYLTTQMMLIHFTHLYVSHRYVIHSLFITVIYSIPLDTNGTWPTSSFTDRHHNRCRKWEKYLFPSVSRRTAAHCSVTDSVPTTNIL